MTWRDYLGKMAGTGQVGPPRVSVQEILWSWIGGFLGIGLVGWLDARWCAGTDLSLLIGSQGASAVLVFGAIRSPLAQPRNLVGGHLISALAGVAAYQGCPSPTWLAAALAVASAIALMHATRTLHPPGGATALIAVIGSDQIHRLGWLYVLMPVALGALLLLGVALVVNNLSPRRSYPEAWY